MENIRELIDQKIMDAGKGIPDTVAESLAKVEIDRRIRLITSAFIKQEELEKELKKIDRGDQENYVEGVLVTSMSKPRFEAVKKAKEQIKNLSDSLEKALENTFEGYKKLEETLNKVKGSSEKPKDATE